MCRRGEPANATCTRTKPTARWPCWHAPHNPGQRLSHSRARPVTRPALPMAALCAAAAACSKWPRAHLHGCEPIVDLDAGGADLADGGEVEQVARHNGGLVRDGIGAAGAGRAATPSISHQPLTSEPRRRFSFAGSMAIVWSTSVGWRPQRPPRPPARASTCNKTRPPLSPHPLPHPHMHPPHTHPPRPPLRDLIQLLPRLQHHRPAALAAQQQIGVVVGRAWGGAHARA